MLVDEANILGRKKKSDKDDEKRPDYKLCIHTPAKNLVTRGATYSPGRLGYLQVAAAAATHHAAVVEEGVLLEMKSMRL